MVPIDRKDHFQNVHFCESVDKIERMCETIPTVYKLFNLINGPLLHEHKPLYMHTLVNVPFL